MNSYNSLERFRDDFNHPKQHLKAGSYGTLSQEERELQRGGFLFAQGRSPGDRGVAKRANPEAVYQEPLPEEEEGRYMEYDPSAARRDSVEHTHYGLESCL